MKENILYLFIFVIYKVLKDSTKIQIHLIHTFLND